MSHTELPITGYLDRFSHRPGNNFTAFVSVRDATDYRVRLVRVIGGDPNPSGPGIRLDPLPNLDLAIAGRRQPINLGSYGIVPTLPPRDPRTACTLTALICPGLVDRPQAVISIPGLSLTIGSSGVAGRIGALECGVNAPMRPGCWFRVWLSVDPASGQVVVGQHRLGQPAPLVSTTAHMIAPLPTEGPALIAAIDPAAPSLHFTGKIEDPAILAGAVTAWPDPLPMPDLPVLAAWDFSRDIPTQRFVDVGPHGCHGTLVNLPTRAVVGARWTGREQAWRHAPRDYAAIHFHADDLGDCAWDPSFTWSVPDDLPSGAYALHLSCPAGDDWLPFYVLPKRQGPFAPIAFLASTFTYLAYANHARDSADAAYMERVAAWDAYPCNPDHYPLYGRSMYNVHLDGSGVAFSSRRRPILTMRPGFLTFNDAAGSGLRHYPADTHLLGWLDAKGIAFDVITDEDLDEEGVALLKPYKAVLTGSHPEYHTAATLDALAEYTADGGRMAYLGGDGFYWRVARDPAMPWAMELRRAEGGIRTWAAEPGEYYHQFDGEYGGLWRRNRRPPQMLCGVGFSGQGLFEGTHYRLTPEARSPRFAWLVEGIDSDILGDYGLSGGGAAGFELDRADNALGTPDGAVILARSENPPASFFTVPEEVLAGRRTVSGEKLEALIRGEIVYFETSGGGAVFSVGSITFCGSLWRNGYEGPVSRLLENVVRRFGAG
jgi:N,N-dimethylformamidase